MESVGTGWAVEEVEGRVHRMKFDPEAVDRASEWIERHRAFGVQQLDGLAISVTPQTNPRNEEDDDGHADRYLTSGHPRGGRVASTSL